MTLSRCAVCFAMVAADATRCDVCGSPLPSARTPGAPRGVSPSETPPAPSRSRGPADTPPRQGAKPIAVPDQTGDPSQPDEPATDDPSSPLRRFARSNSFFVVDFDPLPASAIEGNDEKQEEPAPDGSLEGGGGVGAEDAQPPRGRRAPRESRPLEPRSDRRKPEAQQVVPPPGTGPADDVGTAERPGSAGRRSLRPDSSDAAPGSPASPTGRREPRVGKDWTTAAQIAASREPGDETRAPWAFQDVPDDPPPSEEWHRDMRAFEAEVRTSEARLSEARKDEDAERRGPDGPTQSKDAPSSGAWRRAGRPTPTRPIADPWSANPENAGEDARSAASRVVDSRLAETRAADLRNFPNPRPGSRGLQQPPADSRSLPADSTGSRPLTERLNRGDEGRERSIDDQWAEFMTQPSDDFKRRLSSVPWRGLVLVLVVAAVVAGLVVLIFSNGLHQFWEPPPSAGGSAIPRAAIPAVGTSESAGPATAGPAQAVATAASAPEPAQPRTEPEPQPPVVPIEPPERRASPAERGPAARAPAPAPREPAPTTPSSSSRLAQVPSSAAPLGDSSPEDSPRRMAEFLVRTLGREAAAEHSRRAGALYGANHAQGEYWAGVLRYVQTLPE
jgi:hypothetical protein